MAERRKPRSGASEHSANYASFAAHATRLAGANPGSPARSGCERVPILRKHRISQRLPRLAAKIGEKCGLGTTLDNADSSICWTAGMVNPFLSFSVPVRQPRTPSGRRHLEHSPYLMPSPRSLLGGKGLS